MCVHVRFPLVIEHVTKFASSPWDFTSAYHSIVPSHISTGSSVCVFGSFAKGMDSTVIGLLAPATEQQD